MELIQLLSFYEIVKTKSFSKASINVFRTQSAVSHQIKNLETELKVKLFNRLGKSVELTEEGEILFHIVNKIFSNLENLKRIYADMKNGKIGNLSIGASSAVMSGVLPEIVKDFISQFPEINFRLVTCSSISEIKSLVLDGKADFGIGIKSNQIFQQKLEFLPWRSFDTFLITAKTHPLIHKKNIKLIDIATYPHIIHGKGSMLRKVIEEVYFQNKLTYKIIIEMDTAENIKSYVEMGIGVGILSSVTVNRKDKKRLAIFNVSNIFGKIAVGIYYRKDRYISTAMRQFIKLFAPELLSNLVPCEAV